MGSDPTPFAENKFAVRDMKNLSLSFTHPETYPTCPSMSKPAIFLGKWKDLYADPTPACSDARSSRKLPSVLRLVDVLQNIHEKSSEYREGRDDNAQARSLVAGDEQVSSQAVFALEILLPDGPCCQEHFHISLLAVYQSLSCPRIRSSMEQQLAYSSIEQIDSRGM